MANDPNQDWTRTKPPHENAQNVARHLRSGGVVSEPSTSSLSPLSNAELIELIKQMQVTINNLSSKVDALSRPVEDVSAETGMPGLSTTEIDDIVMTRLLNYIAEQIRPAILSLLESGKATAYDFIDRDLQSETFGRFLQQEQIIKKIEDLTRSN